MIKLFSMKVSQKIYLPFKRSISIFGSILGICFCLVLFWWWALIINLFVTKGHPFFVSKRIGQNGKEIKLIKFRSMKFDTKPNMASYKRIDDTDVTKFGKFLRTTSIDETPQLLNIFIGQMAFIGPRPLVENEIDSITIQKRKENGSIILKPGLSGFAQIHKRGDLDPETKSSYDLQYLKEFSLIMDIKIFVYTILKLFGAVKGR